MTSALQTTVVALFYALPPAINFARLVADLDSALAGLPHGERRITWDCDDVAMVDVDGARIVLAWADRLPGALQACLAVSVGPGPDSALPDRLSHRAAPLAQLIADRIATRMPPASIVWHTEEGVMTSDRLDIVTEALAAATAAEAVADMPAEPIEEAEAAPVAETVAAGPTPGLSDPAALDRLMARMERELSAARAAATLAAEAPHQTAVEAAPPEPAEATEPPKPAAPVLRPQPPRTGTARAAGALARARARSAAAAAAAVANDLPDLPRPALAEAARIRSALYPVEEAAAEQASTPARLAVGTLGVTLLMTAAPVGAALLTYNTLRGANLAVTARAVALTGAALALLETPVVKSLLMLG
jgi:hypothetical protein